MSKVTCKICRRLGFSVCGREKCAFKRKPYPPGIHGRVGSKPGGRRSNVSEYGAQLKEKQKVKFLYGLRERQFKNLILKAIKAKGAETKARIIQLLETRLDNAVFRSGFASSRNKARQLVSHGHINVNGRKATIPSYQLRIGQTFAVRPQSLGRGAFRDLDLYLKKYQVPDWLNLDKDKKESRLADMPDAQKIDVGASLNAVIEFYSR
jgi:small subunit ribosomal protein S4